VSLLDLASVGERSARPGRWSSWPPRRRPARWGGIADESGFDPARVTGEYIFEVLNRLVLEDEAA
jgi:hypothetical protein